MSKKFEASEGGCLESGSGSVGQYVFTHVHIAGDLQSSRTRFMTKWGYVAENRAIK